MLSEKRQNKTDKKMKTRFKALAFLAIMAVLLPMSLSAQKSDGFFNNFDNEDLYNDRLGITIGGGGITPQGIGEAPVGSGLLVLVAVGAGYAVMRRKGVKGIKGVNAIIMAMVLLLGMTQCKKRIETVNHADSNKVHITLHVDNGSRVVIDTAGTYTPDFATVIFESGDIMYVGYNKSYVGYLTYDGEDFNGDIDIAQTVDDEPLYFYFIGGKGFTPTIENNVATLDISNQTEKYPIVNFGHSVEVYPSATGDYTARLLNKCGIVKFHVSKPIYNNETTGTSIMGMNNVVTVNFDYTAANTDDGFTYSMVNGGEITIPSNVGNVWAILLPQDQNTNVYAFSKYCATQDPVTIPQIAANDFKPNGINLNLTHTLISVSATQQVCFAPGNLQYLGNANGTGTWRFAEHQYDFMGDGPSSGTSYQGNVTVSGFTKYNASADLDVARDLFGWGTSGYDNKYPYMTTTADNYYKYSTTDTDYDWGIYHKASGNSTEKIINGGDKEWRLWTNSERYYVFQRNGRVYTRPDYPTYSETKSLFASATVLGVKGIIVFPDNWTGSLDRSIKYENGSSSGYTKTICDNEEKWAMFEKLGCVFLPAAYVRSGTGMTSVNEGHYWSSTVIQWYSEYRGAQLEFTGSGTVTLSEDSKWARRLGMAVRLIYNVTL